MGFHFLFFILIFIYFFKYETIVSTNGLSLGCSERDTSSVAIHNHILPLQDDCSGIFLAIAIVLILE